jgi:hypothetical protein
MRLQPLLSSWPEPLKNNIITINNAYENYSLKLNITLGTSEDIFNESID